MVFLASRVGLQFVDCFLFHKTARGVLPSHVGMRVRFNIKYNSTLGLVTAQKGTIVDFLFKEEDRVRYNQCRPGELFRPRFHPAGIWLQLDDFDKSPIWEELMPHVQNPSDVSDGAYATQAARAKGLILFTPVETEFTWRSSETHTVRRIGFPLTHASFLTSTASQGQTLRTGVTIDCGRLSEKTCKDSDWWLHLYVMFSRVTCMEDMLLLRPPPREILEAGPPADVRVALAQFEEKIKISTEATASFAEKIGFALP